jgi:hypothetical protein
MLFLTLLGSLGWKHFAVSEPFYVWLPLTVAIAYFGSIALTALLARTPLAVPLTGRKREPWGTLLPRLMPGPALATAGGSAPAPEPAALAVPLTDRTGTDPAD